MDRTRPGSTCRARRRIRRQTIPRVVPNPLDNTLLIQATPQEYESILNLLRNLDVPPRQVLIEAKIYEVSLTGSLSAGLQTYLQIEHCTGSGRVPAGNQRAGRRISGARTRALHRHARRAEPRIADDPGVRARCHPHEGDLRAEHHRHRQHPGVHQRGHRSPDAHRPGRHGRAVGRQFALCAEHSNRNTRCNAEHPGARESERHRDDDHQPGGQRAGAAGHERPSSRLPSASGRYRRR